MRTLYRRHWGYALRAFRYIPANARHKCTEWRVSLGCVCVLRSSLYFHPATCTKLIFILFEWDKPEQKKCIESGWAMNSKKKRKETEYGIKWIYKSCTPYQSLYYICFDTWVLHWHLAHTHTVCTDARNHNKFQHFMCSHTLHSRVRRVFQTLIPFFGILVCSSYAAVCGLGLSLNRIRHSYNKMKMNKKKKLSKGLHTTVIVIVAHI